MNKELTPLQALEQLKGGYKNEDLVAITRSAFEKNIDIIETALKELEEYKSILKDFSLENPQNLIDNLNIIKDCKFHKKLKALEIITQRHFTFDDSKHEVWLGNEWITDIKEEYELLKEILK